MAKPKESKNAKGHLKARLEFLHQASQYLHQSSTKSDRNQPKDMEVTGPPDNSKDVRLDGPQVISLQMEKDTGSNVKGPTTARKSLTNLSRICISQMRGVSLKTQMRLPVTVKRSFCKRCDTVMDFQTTALQEVQNDSKGRKKPWADVRVVCCLVCGTEKRFPLAGKRSQKLALREKVQKQGQASLS